MRGWVALLKYYSLTDRRIYPKIASSNMSRLEAHVGFFRLLMKGIFGPKIGTVTFWQKIDLSISNAQ